MVGLTARAVDSGIGVNNRPFACFEETRDGARFSGSFS
jgi:hypothetical protein